MKYGVSDLIVEERANGRRIWMGQVTACFLRGYERMLLL